MTKTATSLSLSKMAKDYLETLDNKSAPVNTVLETLLRNRTTINYIEAISQNNIDYKKLIELGLEALKNEADRHKYTNEYVQSITKPVESKRKSLKIAVREALSTGIREFDTLVDYLTEQGYTVSVRASYEPNQSRPYYYENRWLGYQSDNSVAVNNRGEIYNYSTGI